MATGDDANGLRGWIYREMKKTAVRIFGAIVPVSVIFMGLLLVAGLYDLYLAVLAFHWPWLHTAAGAAAEASNQESIRATIDALEMFLLAPLAYLLLVSLASYVDYFEEEPSEQRSNALAKLPEMKAFTASMLVSLVAVHLVGKVLEEKATLSWSDAGIQLLIMAVLAAHFLVLERKCERAEGSHPPKP